MVKLIRIEEGWGDGWGGLEHPSRDATLKQKLAGTRIRLSRKNGPRLYGAVRRCKVKIRDGNLPPLPNNKRAHCRLLEVRGIVLAEALVLSY